MTPKNPISEVLDTVLEVEKAYSKSKTLQFCGNKVKSVFEIFDVKPSKIQKKHIKKLSKDPRCRFSKDHLMHAAWYMKDGGTEVNITRWNKLGHGFAMSMVAFTWLCAAMNFLLVWLVIRNLGANDPSVMTFGTNIITFALLGVGFVWLQKEYIAARRVLDLEKGLTAGN